MKRTQSSLLKARALKNLLSDTPDSTLMAKAAELFGHTVSTLNKRKDEIEAHIGSGKPQIAGLDYNGLSLVKNKLARYRGLYSLSNGKLDEETASEALQATQERIAA